MLSSVYQRERYHGFMKTWGAQGRPWEHTFWAFILDLDLAGKERRTGRIFHPTNPHNPQPDITSNHKTNSRGTFYQKQKERLLYERGCFGFPFPFRCLLLHPVSFVATKLGKLYLNRTEFLRVAGPRNGRDTYSIYKLVPRYLRRNTDLVCMFEGGTLK